MAKEIVWTETSVNDRLMIYQYWQVHNKSDTYSEKLEILFNESAKLIALFPGIGANTDFNDIKVKVVRDYKIFYRIDDDRIVIIRVWDSRQDPVTLKVDR
jgi:plasmid stabilization system protein ParE